MARDWEATFGAWKAPSSTTEQEKQDHAEQMIKDAINAHGWFSGRKYRIYAKGSYANRTNVRQDSDVDIVVEMQDCIFSNRDEIPNFDHVRANLGTGGCTYTFAEFKNEVEKALIAKFPAGSVTRGKKAFDIQANTYRVSADVVPCYEWRRYFEDYTRRKGTKFLIDGGGSIINYPEQQYTNGVAKNTATGGRFKDLVRIVKRLRNEMAANGIKEAEPIPSYLIECLVYVVPNDHFQHARYSDDIRSVLAFLFNNTRTSDEASTKWTEVNNYKFLFHASQPWTKAQAHGFVSTAWNYIGFS